MGRQLAAHAPLPGEEGVLVDVLTLQRVENACGLVFLMQGNVRLEIDFPQGTDPYSDPVYAKAVENFKNLQDDGHLIRENSRTMYVYQQKWGDHVQKGIVALSHTEDYQQDLIK